jgi:hypothetical protein
MTRDRELERVLDGWLADGPSTMPDRFFDDLLDRVDRTPQRRLAGLTTRFLTMHATTRRIAFAAALAVTIVVLAVAAIGSGPRPSPTSAPTSPPSPPSPVASLGTLDAALTHRWIGPTRPVSGMAPPAVTAAVILEGGRMRFDAGGAPRTDLVSSAGILSANAIQFSLVANAAGCSRGDVGTYTYTLSAGGGFLSLQPVADACTARSDALTGAWERSDCPNPGAWCLGDLEAGEHRSAVFNPFLSFDAWTFDYGRLSYTVPAGWANDEEDRAQYVISKAGLGEDASIWLLSDEAAHLQGDACPENVTDASVGRTPTELVAWVRSLPGLVAFTPEQVTIGGLPGVTFELSMRSTFTRRCPGADAPSIQLFADSDGKEHDVSLHGATPMRIWLLDLGDGRSLVMFVNAVDNATYEAILPEATSIIGTFVFHR